MEKILLETLVEKVDAHERRISGQDKEIHEMTEMVKDQSYHREFFEQVNCRLEELLHHIKTIRFPENEMRQLSSTILSNFPLLKQPTKREVFHHHHIPKIMYLLVVLFIMLSLVLAGW